MPAEEYFNVDAMWFFGTILAVAAILLIAILIVQSCRPSQRETEDEQLEAFRKRTKRIRAPKFGRIDTE